MFLRHSEIICYTASVLDNPPSPGTKWLDSPSCPAEHQIHSPEAMCYKSAESSHQGVDFWTSIFRALCFHIGIYLEVIRREVGKMGLVRRGRVLAVEVSFLPVLDTTRQDRLGKERALTSL